ncbi:hypothetical protein HPB52_014032 [Rhipicephalus sanguineus]|uniref:Uncharacterized protein n=1 Tax=Rhipicephalus sanguineus TaxID=34632 RepID=A0A9D4PWG3_RHISA|nr:hypothetical protein HPB52_014032 [Rhipicephalus sanguineus]
MAPIDYGPLPGDIAHNELWALQKALLNLDNNEQALDNHTGGSPRTGDNRTLSGAVDGNIPSDALMPLGSALCPATFTHVLPPVPLSPLGPIFRRSWPSPPATKRPCPHSGHLDSARLSQVHRSLDMPTALGARAKTPTPRPTPRRSGAVPRTPSV